MCDVCTSHEHVVTAHAGQPATTHRAGVDGDELADRIVVSDLESRGLATVLEVLWLTTDGDMRKDAVVLTDGRMPVDRAVGSDPGSSTNFDVRSDDGKRTDLDILGDLGVGVNRRSFGDPRQLDAPLVRWVLVAAIITLAVVSGSNLAWSNYKCR